MRRRAFVTATVTAAGTLVAGCAGGDTGDGDGGSDGGGGGGGGAGYGGGGGGGATTRTETTTDGDGGTSSGDGSVAQEEYPDYDWDELEGAEPTETTSVTLRDTAFHPLVAEVSAGAEVTFTNEDSHQHSVTVPAMDVDQGLPGGSSTTLSFDGTGTFDYLCTFHPPGMVGRVVVE